MYISARLGRLNETRGYTSITYKVNPIQIQEDRTVAIITENDSPETLPLNTEIICDADQASEKHI